MCTITKETVSQDGRFRNCLSIIENDDIRMVSYKEGAQTAFVGVAANDVVSLPALRERQCKLLIKAVNNRTRERNYFRLCNQLAENELTEDKFDEEIDRNEDDYVVPEGDDTSMEDLEAALSIAPYLKGVDSTDDFLSLFSIADHSITKYIEGSRNV